MVIGVILLAIYLLITVKQPTKYDTIILTNGGSAGAVFDDSYKVTLSDESLGTVEIKFIEQGLDDWGLHAVFSKKGKSEVILESPGGEKTVFEINVERNTYTINKKE